MTQRYYITTPIYYVNGAPHIGHAYTSIAADVLARWKRLDGYDVFFLTGTDEHGQKVEKAAAEAGLDPQPFADRVSADFRDMADRMGISYDDFIRTTEPRHKAACAALWQRLEDAGQIYLGHYEGWYAVRDEAFYAEDELDAGRTAASRARAARRWSGCSEPSLLLPAVRMAGPAAGLLRRASRISSRPPARRNEVLSFVRGGLHDLSISRTSFTLGHPGAGRPGHVMYVWLDALTNYITAVRLPGRDATRAGRSGRPTCTSSARTSSASTPSTGRPS